MERGEDATGAAPDAVEGQPTRETPRMVSATGEDPPAAPSPAMDEEACHNTETILNMIDEFIDEPRTATAARYSADSTVSGHTPPREAPSTSGSTRRAAPTDNGVPVGSPEQSVVSSRGATEDLNLAKDKQLENMVNDISSSSSASQGPLTSENGGNESGELDNYALCKPAESCSKADNLPGQRRKLVRPALPKDSSSEHLEEFSGMEGAAQEASGSNEVPTQSYKKVKLVRRSNAKPKPLIVSNIPAATLLRVDSSSSMSVNVSDSNKLKDRLQSVEQSSSGLDTSADPDPVQAHSSRECLGNVSKCSGSDAKDVPSVNKLDTSDVSLTNSLNSVSVCDYSAAVDKTNDVLDVRKVSPLRLSRSTIEESRNTNINATKHNTEVQNNNVVNQTNVDECKNVPKLTLKIGSKFNEDNKGCNKMAKLNAKATKAPETVSESLPAGSKLKQPLGEFSKSGHNIPNLIKLNIKPLHISSDSEGDINKEKSSSSSSEASECESSENEVISECIQSPTVETTECELGERSVPKLTIKSLSTVPKVDCEVQKHKVGRRLEESSEPPVVPKLHIKPLIPPPLEKMTIKLNKSTESESKCEMESVPKMTIKLGKVQENATVIENNCEDEKVESALKMKIKLGKSVENSTTENDVDNLNEHCPVTRLSKRIHQKQEHVAEQHVPKLTIKIPQEHESKTSEKSSNSPIPKLTIKPLIKPEEVERSSSPTVPKLIIKPILKPDEHESRVDESDPPSIPKLTIKPIPKPDDQVTDRCPSPTIIKLHIKPVVKPDELEAKLSDTTDSHGIPKLTIKTVKADDHDMKQKDRVSSPIPKITIKPVVRPDESEAEPHTIPKLTIKPVIKHNESVSETEMHSVPKLTIKPLIKPDNSSESVSKLSIKSAYKPDMPEVETLSVPKITIKPVVKYDENISLSVPSLTIKSVIKPDESNVDSIPKLTIKNLHKTEEPELRRSERCASPSTNKHISKHAGKFPTPESEESLEVSVVHKLTIKPILKCDEQPAQESNIMLKSVISDDEVTKVSIKDASECSESGKAEHVVEKSEEVTVRTRSKVSLEEAVGKLNSKLKSTSEPCIELKNEITPKLITKHTEENSVPCEDKPEVIPENLCKPLEVMTSLAQSSPSHQDSGLDSPRIILKINKCAQGSVSEVLMDDIQKNVVENIDKPHKVVDKPPEVPEKGLSTQSNDVPSSVERKTKICEIINSCDERKPVNDIQKDIIGKSDENSEISKENDEKLLKIGTKRTRSKAAILSKCFDKSSLSTQAKRQKLDNAITNLHNKNKRKSSITVSLMGSREESIISNKSDSADNILSGSLSESVLTNNGETSLNDIIPKVSDEDHNTESINSFEKINENSTVLEGDSNATSTRSSDDTESNQLGTDSPIFNKVDRNMLVLNEETNSQECMMIDELSQDPLDIESAAKSHFAPITAPTTPLMSIKDTIKIVEPSPMVVGLVPQPKKRGRPRKHPLPEGVTPTPVKPSKEPKTSPKLPTPALEERPVRVLRTPRERPAILRTPRTRGGRGRGGNRRGAAHTSFKDAATSPPDSPINKTVKYFELTEKTETTTTPCKVAISRLEQEDVAEDEEYCTSVRGRGGHRTYNRRGGRRPRGKGSRGGLLKCGQRGEEVQLQEALPLATPIGRREGRKSRLEPTLTPALEVFEEETCMIGDNVTPKRHIGLVDEESQSSVLSGQTVSENGTKAKRPKLMDMLDEGHKEWTAADVAEYDWPPEGTNSKGEPPQTVMIQEQVALYLGVKSFKRRYPDLKRRQLSADEKNYLRDRGLISEALCDLGVTAVDAGEVLDIMFTDYPDKYEEYRKHLRERREAKPPPGSTNKLGLAAQPAKQAVSRQEILEKACESAASWNAQLNKQRKTQRPASMDLQTLTLHKPQRPPTVQEPNPNALTYYPVALLPGQFTDFYRDYTPEELRYFPLNTVMSLLPSPKPVVESSSEESDSNSDSDHSSGSESDSETSTVDTNTRRKTLAGKAKSRQSIGNASRPASPSLDSTPIKTENIKSEPSASSSHVSDIPNRCKICDGSEFANKRNPNEAFITCATCRRKIHPSCLDMSLSVTKCVRAYAWQCADCKCCGQCGDLADDDKMLFCDLCDRGYHIYCVGLKKVPTGRWHCMHCAMCRSCGSRNPSGPQGIDLPVSNSAPDQWHHHFKRTNSGQRIYSHTLCAPCAQAWRSGRFCPSCEKCFVGRKGAMGLVICVRCDRRYHQECIRQVRKQLDVLNFLCSSCRRGINPKHILRRGERTPRKPVQSFAESSMHSIVTDSSSSMHNASSVMDQGGDSSSAIDSMQPSPVHDRNNDSNSMSDLPLTSLKKREAANQDLEDNDSEINSVTSGIDFKTASRRLFSVGDSLNGSNKPSECRLPNVCLETEKGDVEDSSASTSKVNSNVSSPGNSGALPRDPLETPDDVEGGA